MTYRTVAIIGTRGYPSYYGGFETAVRKLAPYLADSGWNVVVYGRPGATKDDDPIIHSAVHRISTRGVESKSLSTLSYGFTATIDAVRRKPDVALVMNVANGFFLPLLRLRGIKTVVNVDGIEWDRAKWGKLAKFIFRMGARMTARYANHLVFDSLEIARRWKSEFDRVGTFIPYGGDPAPELPIEPGLVHRGYVLAVARFVPENSIPEFFEAVDEISKVAHVVIVGSSGYGGELDTRAADLQRDNANVTWTGHISDDDRLLSLWQHAGVYFHGHSVGGTNPTLVQAMALGVPIVARDTPYNREVIGEKGVFCEATPESIIESILELYTNTELQVQMSGDVISRARESYSWISVNSRYADLLGASLKTESS